MIYKSHLIEKKINSVKENVILFYGENYGIKKDFKEKIRKTNKDCEFLLFDQKNILENSSILYNELYNTSLFEKNKVLFLENVNDRILDIIQDVHLNLDNQKIYLFSDILEKKSKLRNFFEKSDNCAVIPCYIDNEVTIKNLILEKLKGYDGLTAYNLNLILNHVSLDRIKLNNEIEKIIAYFIDKKVKTRELSILLDVNVGTGGIALDANGSSNFTTNSGTMTLEGKTGVNINENGSTIIAIDTDRNISTFRCRG